MALAAGFDMRQEGLGAVDHAPEVDVHDPLVVGVVIAFHGAALGHAGIVEDRVDPAEFGYHLVCPGMYGLTVGDVDQGFADLHTELARLGSGFRQALGIHIGERQLATLTGQTEGQGAADAGTCAGDGGYLVFKRLHALASWAVNWIALFCAGCAACLRLK